MLIADQWFADMPQQFLGKKNIEVLIRAFARQMQELAQVFGDLTEKTDLDTAAGQNLDYVGTIIPLTRKEAGELAGIGVAEPVISDERYRLFLRYQLLRNASEGTYYDLIDGIELMWGYKGIHYLEEPRYPATIIFQTDRMELDTEDLVEFHPELCIRAGGVGVILRKYYGGSFKVPTKYTESIRFLTGFYPRFNLPRLYLDGSWRLDGTRNLSGYNSLELVDLYPVSARLQAAAAELPKEVAQIHLRTSAGDEAGLESGAAISARSSVESGGKSGMETAIRAGAAQLTEERAQMRLHGHAGEQPENEGKVFLVFSAESGAEAEEQLCVRSLAAAGAAAGDIGIYNRNRLEGGWKLNGSRKLNGGMESR